MQAVQIEALLNNELRDTVKYYVNKYGDTFERRLGLMADDLVNDMREQIWKGILTFKKRGAANFKTYLNNIIKNRFLVLLKRSSIKKNSSVDYFADVFAASGIDRAYVEAEDTSETLLQRRQELQADLAGLPESYGKILADLLAGYSLADMEKRHDMTRPEVTTAVNAIHILIATRRAAA